MRTLLMAVTLALLAACGDDDDSGGGGGGGSPPAPSCTVKATVTANSQHIVQGLGEVTCQAAATISVETCLQWDADDSFADVQCQTITVSDLTTSQNPTSVSCTASLGHRFRARVNATVGGTALPEALSSEVVCE